MVSILFSSYHMVLIRCHSYHVVILEIPFHEDTSTKKCLELPWRSPKEHWNSSSNFNPRPSWTATITNLPLVASNQWRKLASCPYIIPGSKTIRRVRRRQQWKLVPNTNARLAIAPFQWGAAAPPPLWNPIWWYPGLVKCWTRIFDLN